MTPSADSVMALGYFQTTPQIENQGTHIACRSHITPYEMSRAADFYVSLYG
jgi:hypothetical protein